MKSLSLVLFFFSILFFSTTKLLSQTGTFTVHFPKLEYPINGYGPLVWGKYNPYAHNDSIVVPNGRPIYALIVSGYSSNRYFDQLMVYNFARHLMEHGAYVHYAWWNNLLAPYMERPLHYDQSYPGNLHQDFTKFTTAQSVQYKGIPGEDYQFVADAKLFLSAIRQHNPNAIIIVVGHSMGGGAVVHLASQTNVRIDILGLIDPVGNRNFPFAGDRLPIRGTGIDHDYNWTRWRITRNHFLGYKRRGYLSILKPCAPLGNWLETWTEAEKQTSLGCKLQGQGPYIDPASTLAFRSNVVHLYYRYQKEAKFPFDYWEDYKFGHVTPAGGSNYEASIQLKSSKSDPDPGGLPNTTAAKNNGDSCGCEISHYGVGWPKDGHGEIIGYRGPIPTPIPLGVRVRTSPDITGSLCPNKIWPWRAQLSSGVWVDPNSAFRKTILMNFENLPADSVWEHRPYNPDLDLVSGDLIKLFDGIVTDIKDIHAISQVPKDFQLDQNYPNPFNPSTVIKFYIAKDSKVKIDVYDILGRDVSTLLNEEEPVGYHEVNFNASNLSSGIYFYRMQAYPSTGSGQSFVQIKKLVLLK